MTQKPEWFELAENDEQTADFISPAKVKGKKSLPATAALASLAIIVGGAFFANAHNETSASADEQTPPAITQNSGTASTSTLASGTSTTPSDPSAPSATTQSGNTPSIGQLPQGRGGDDQGEDDGDHPFPPNGQRPPHHGEGHGDRPALPADDSEED